MTRRGKTSGGANRAGERRPSILFTYSQTEGVAGCLGPGGHGEGCPISGQPRGMIGLPDLRAKQEFSKK